MSVSYDDISQVFNWVETACGLMLESRDELDQFQRGIGSQIHVATWGQISPNLYRDVIIANENLALKKFLKHFKERPIEYEFLISELESRLAKELSPINYEDYYYLTSLEAFKRLATDFRDAVWFVVLEANNHKYFQDQLDSMSESERFLYIESDGFPDDLKKDFGTKFNEALSDISHIDALTINRLTAMNKRERLLLIPLVESDEAKTIETQSNPSIGETGVSKLPDGTLQVIKEHQTEFHELYMGVDLKNSRIVWRGLSISCSKNFLLIIRALCKSRIEGHERRTMPRLVEIERELDGVKFSDAVNVKIDQRLIALIERPPNGGNTRDGYKLKLPSEVLLPAT